MRIIIRTHGGLGNQLFQVFFGRLYSRKYGELDVIIIHDENYQHRFNLSEKFENKLKPHLIERVVSGLRIPKIITKMNIAKIDRLNLYKANYFDGYFQDPEQYVAFSDNHIRDELNRLRKEFSLNKDCDRETLVHLRLGDFFGHESDEIEHLKQRLSKIPYASHVISNRDDMLSRQEYLSVLAKHECRHIPTQGQSPESLLRLMCRYRTIESNNSTLAFWASVLAGSDVKFTLPNLIKLRCRLINI